MSHVSLIPYWLYALELVMVSIGSLFLLTACPIDPLSSRHSAEAQASLDLFETHVHPLFAEMGCQGCHNKTGIARGHPFADDDIETAHEYAQTKVNFDDIKNSALVTRQVPGGHSCDQNSSECDDNAKKLIAALTKWQESRDQAAEKSLSLTSEKDADLDEPGDYTEHRLKFSITKLIDADADTIGSVILEVAVSKSMIAKTLQLNNFIIKTTNVPIFLGGLIAKRNGKDSSDRTKMRACALVKPSDDDQNLTQFDTTFSLTEEDSSPNNISFGLKDLRVATSEDTCGDESVAGNENAKRAFDDKTSVIGGIISDGCTTSCHNPTAGQVPDLSTFAQFYTNRAAIKESVMCTSPESTSCMPPAQATTWPGKQALLVWLETLDAAE